MPESVVDSHASSAPNSVAELQLALAEGNLQKVQALVDAGADLHYKRVAGYDALIDAVHGRDIARDPLLLELLAFLVKQEVALSGVSSYGESGLRVLSHLGRFDAVRLLLDAGADRSHLEWTPLIEAVALDTLADMQDAIAQEGALESRDRWSRTAWLVALLTGDIAKAILLREHGADTRARGNCGAPPLFHAIHCHHPEMVRWLLREGADVHQTDEFGSTALMEAVERDDLECVEILLDAGADVFVDAIGTAVSKSTSREITLRLLDHGADPADADQRVLLGLQETDDEAFDAVTPEEFQRAYTRRFGKGNPERMSEPYWVAMIRCGASAYTARQHFGLTYPTIDQPVWCAQRFGQSLTFLPDERAVQIAREHEDYYHPDFCIYNDVFVHEADGSIAKYGYPESVFPPTDFHTATLMGNSIYVIGSLGYQGARRYHETPVYRLDLRTWRMTPLRTRGEAPGWIYKHRAVAVSPHEIRVWGGTIAGGKANEETQQPNLASFVLDVNRLIWRKEATSGP